MAHIQIEVRIIAELHRYGCWRWWSLGTIEVRSEDSIPADAPAVRNKGRTWRSDG